MIIGVTGTSGSGKTTISYLLREKLKCNVVNADSIAKGLSKKGNDYYNDIVEYFGEEILDEEQEINRPLLAEIIYGDEEKRKKLNSITNNHVVDIIKKEAFKFEEDNGIVVIDVPRLIETNLNRICNIVISVLADVDIKLERICKRDDMDIERAKQRLRIQPKDEYYINNSDYVVITNGDNAGEQIDNIVSQIIKEKGKNEFNE